MILRGYILFRWNDNLSYSTRSSHKIQLVFLSQIIFDEIFSRFLFIKQQLNNYHIFDTQIKTEI